MSGENCVGRPDLLETAGQRDVVHDRRDEADEISSNLAALETLPWHLRGAWPWSFTMALGRGGGTNSNKVCQGLSFWRTQQRLS